MNKIVEKIALLVILAIVGYIPAGLMAMLVLIVLDGGYNADTASESKYIIALLLCYIPVFIVLRKILPKLFRQKPIKDQPLNGIINMRQFQFRVPGNLLVSKIEDGLTNLIDGNNSRFGVTIITAGVLRSDSQTFQEWVQEETSVPKSEVSAPAKDNFANRPVAYAQVDSDHYYFLPVKLESGQIFIMEVCISSEPHLLEITKKSLEQEWQWLDDITDEEANRAIERLIT